MRIGNAWTEQFVRHWEFLRIIRHWEWTDTVQQLKSLGMDRGHTWVFSASPSTILLAYQVYTTDPFKQRARQASY